MLICRNKKNGSIVPDFQSNPAPGTLIRNAVNAGLGLAEDFEEVDVTRQDFDTYRSDHIQRNRAAQEAIANKRAADVVALKQKLKVSLNLTDDELNTLFNSR